MEYPNSPQLRQWLEQSGWGVTAGQDTFILNETEFREQRELLVRHKVRAEHLDDRAAFRCLTLMKTVHVAAPKTDSEAVAQQQRQIAERAKQQREHEQALLVGLKKTREESVQRAADAIEQARAAEAAILGEIANTGRLITVSQSQISEALRQFSERVSSLELEVGGLRKTIVMMSGDEIRTRERIAEYESGARSAIQAASRRGIRQVLIALGVVGLILLIATLASAQQANVNPAIVGNPSTAYSGRSPIQTDANGAVVVVGGSTAITVAGTVTATITTSGLATSANQTNGTQRTQITDAGGDLATVTGGGLDVNFAAGATVTANFNTANIAVNLTQVDVVTGKPVTVTFATAAPNVTISNTPNVSVVQPVAVSGATSGTPVSVTWMTAAPNVTVANGAGASAVNIQDGGNSITIDGTVSLSGTPNVSVVQPVAVSGATSGVAVSVTFMTASPNVTVSAALPAGTNNIGDVDVLSLPNVSIIQPVVVSGATSGTPVTVTFQTANVATNIAQVSGAVTSATNPLYTRATDGTDAQLVTVGGAAYVDLASVNQANVLVGNGVTGTGSQRVTIASDNSPVPFNLSQVNGATVTTSSGTADGAQRIAVATVDPCSPTSYYARSFTAISLTANSQVITGSTGNYVYICSISLVVAAATNVAVVAGTGSVCATSIGGIFGGTTAATGYNFAANGGISFGAGSGSIGRSDATGENVCILVSAANQTSGSITYVLSP